MKGFLEGKKDLPANGKKTKGRVRIKMEFIHNKLRRYTTFSKRKTGIMKKAFELATLTGTQVMLLVASETGHVYTFATRKLQPMIISDAGKALIQTCLNSPDSDNLLMSNASNRSNGSLSASSSHQANGNGSPGDPSNSNNNSVASSLQAMNSTLTDTNNGQGHSDTMNNQQLSLMGDQSSPQGAASTTSNHQQQIHHQPTSHHQQHHNQSYHNHQQQHRHNHQQQQHGGCDHRNLHLNQFNGLQQQHHQQNDQCHSSSGHLGGSSGAQIQSQHNMLLAANIQSPNSTSATASGQQVNSMQNNRNNSSSNSNGGTNMTANTTTTTDQRMSASGFDETDLSYTIDEDSNERLPRCSNEQHPPSERNALNIRDQIGSSIIGHVHSIDSIEQHQKQHQQQPQFNYNPLYTGLQNFNTSQKAHQYSQGNDKNLNELTSQFSGSEVLLNENDFGLKDIYNYQDDVGRQSGDAYTGQDITDLRYDEGQLDSGKNNANNDTNDGFCQVKTNDNTRQTSIVDDYNQTSDMNNLISGDKTESIRYRTSLRQNIGDSSNRSGSHSPFNQQQLNYNDLLTQSIPMVGTISTINGYQSSRTSQQKQDQASRRKEQDLDRITKRVSLVSNPPHQYPTNNQSNQQLNIDGFQQQFTLGTSTCPQIDLSEDCGGLFVEYQTNRNSLGGGLEELHSLNVANCDSETLEEHINMLSNEDCFVGHEDLQDFGGSADNFLNMLFTSNSNQSLAGGMQSSNKNEMSSQQPLNSSSPPFNQIDLLSHSSCTPPSYHPSSVIISVPPKTTEDSQTDQLNNGIKRKSKSKKGQPTISKSNTESSAKCNDVKSKKESNIRKSPVKSNKSDLTLQNKIVTSNNNKRLLPKKSNDSDGQLTSQGLKNTKTMSNVWSSSPSSTSNTSNSASLSPTSSSQFECEDPYKQQLENLRKKLKMDIIPNPENNSTVKPVLNINSVCPNRKNIIYNATTKTANIQADIPIASIDNNTISTGAKTNCNNMTTYVISRQIDSSALEANPSIYIRTPDGGLVPLNPSPVRRSNLPLMSIASNDIDNSQGSSNLVSATTSPQAQRIRPNSLTTKTIPSSAIDAIATNANNSLLYNCMSNVSTISCLDGIQYTIGQQSQGSSRMI